MGQFKPMVKMETTEPSVELKLKKGGKVVKKADGGMMGAPMGGDNLPPAMPARGGMMGGMPPMKPSLAMRRRAMRGMPAGAGPAGPVGSAAQMQPTMPPGMKKGGKACGMAEGGKMDTAQDKAMIKKAFKQHDMQEHKGGKGTKLALKKGGKTMACATGGVVNGQGGFKKGGKVKMAMGGMADMTGGVVDGQGGYKAGGMAKGGKMPMMGGKPAFLAGKVKMKSGGMACATGGVMKSNGGGYKEGGAPKKAYAAGGTVDSGRPVAMPQGSKPASKPVAINQLAGTYKRGGKVAFKDGGNVDLSKGAYDKSIGPDEEEMDMAKSIRGFPGKVMGKMKSVAKDLFSSMPKTDSVTKTKESVTVAPAGKKRGGSVKC